MFVLRKVVFNVVYLYTQEGNAFLDRIRTCDETWIHHFEPELKRQSMEWKHTHSPIREKFKTQSSARKIMSTVFWDAEAPVCSDFLEDQQILDKHILL